MNSYNDIVFVFNHLLKDTTFRYKKIDDTYVFLYNDEILENFSLSSESLRYLKERKYDKLQSAFETLFLFNNSDKEIDVCIELIKKIKDVDNRLKDLSFKYFIKAKKKNEGSVFNLLAFLIKNGITL
jgi:hypothetical protein